MSDKKDIDKFFPPEEKNIDNDYKYSRDTYYELVEKGKQSPMGLKLRKTYYTLHFGRPNLTI